MEGTPTTGKGALAVLKSIAMAAIPVLIGFTAFTIINNKVLSKSWGGNA